MLDHIPFTFCPIRGAVFTSGAAAESTTRIEPITIELNVALKPGLKPWDVFMWSIVGIKTNYQHIRSIYRMEYGFRKTEVLGIVSFLSTDIIVNQGCRGDLRPNLGRDRPS